MLGGGWMTGRLLTFTMQVDNILNKASKEYQGVTVNFTEEVSTIARPSQEYANANLMDAVREVE